MFITIFYLASLIAANLILTRLGPDYAPLVSFIFIGLDLTLRDVLHEKWHNRNLFRNMTVLIFAGSVLSALLNSASSQIALASFIAFLAAGIVDTLVYNKFFDRNFITKINVSNIAASVVDSFLFITIAFGGFMPLIIGGQIIAKISGGFMWGVLLDYIRRKRGH